MIIAIGGLTHVIAGSTEWFLLLHGLQIAEKMGEFFFFVSCHIGSGLRKCRSNYPLSAGEEPRPDQTCTGLAFNLQVDRYGSRQQQRRSRQPVGKGG